MSRVGQILHGSQAVVRYVGSKVPFLLANIGVMYILHGNSKQFWPKIPYLSLRNESVPEHCRLLFNTLAIVTLGQAAMGRLPRSRVPARIATMGFLPAMLPAMIGFGRWGLRLEGHTAEIYNLSLVPVLPILAATMEDGLVLTMNKAKEQGEPDVSQG